MRRRDRDPRPPVEVLGAEEPADAAQRVAIGRQSGGGHGRGVVVGAVVALLIAGVAFGGGGDDPDASPARDEEEPEEARSPLDERGSSTTRRPRRTTTTSTTATTLPAGPVLPSQTGGALLLAGPGRGGVYVDLDTGARQEVDLAINDHWQLRGVDGGVVAIDAGRAVYLPMPEGEPVQLGPAQEVLSSGRTDRVWLLGDPFAGHGGERTARLVGLNGESLSAEISVPVCCPIGATEDGPVFTAGGRAYVAEAEGLRPLVDGHVLQVTGDHVVRLNCDDRAACRAEALDLASGAATDLGVVPDAFNFGVSVWVGQTGQVAMMVYGPAAPELVLFTQDGRRTEPVVLDARGAAEPSWLPAEHGLVARVFGEGVVRMFERDGALVMEPIAALAGEFGERLIVIPP